MDRGAQIINIGLGVQRQFWELDPKSLSQPLKATAMNVQKAMALRTAPLQTPTDLKAEGVREISGALNILLSGVFALYLKTKNSIGMFQVRTSATIICC